MQAMFEIHTQLLSTQSCRIPPPLQAQVKDIVTASPHFDVAGFIPKLRDYLRVVNPNKRQVCGETLPNTYQLLSFLQYV